jgi:hypothetical protein
MPDIDILHGMIKDSAKVPSDDNFGKKKVTLTESGGSTYSVTIYGMPDNAIVIKADAFTSPTSVFNGSKGECKRADFVLVADTDDKKLILCIEMKAGKGGAEKDIIRQLKGARCFVAYCREIGKSFWNQQDFLNDYVYRFVSIRDISISKRPTRLSPASGDIHDHPEKMLKISSPHRLQFNRLAGGK